jgi:hypothetical protein
MSTPPDQHEIPHRKNAAEWLMFLLIWPVLLLFGCLFTTEARRHGE